ncbi:MAG: hypothetical protein COA90_02815 [Gammaproteobacteria bacterium]|nr:MAG: hypothetical protein COA90_02815 [Gammaproteobacteria bacterium]
MSKWLASVQSAEEARLLLSSLPDILDVKDPSKGALGALNVDKVEEIVGIIDDKCLTSATIGDLAMDSEIIGEKMGEMAKTGVSYVKIGLFPDPSIEQCLIDLEKTVKSLNVPVIAVIFADKPLNVDYLPLLNKSGFEGVMIDTAIKNGKCLLDNISTSELSLFVSEVKSKSMLCGLAGALKLEDIKPLQALGADYLGFRSALCLKRTRTASLQLNLAKQVQKLIHPG